ITGFFQNGSEDVTAIRLKSSTGEGVGLPEYLSGMRRGSADGWQADMMLTKSVNEANFQKVMKADHLFFLVSQLSLPERWVIHAAASIAEQPAPDVPGRNAGIHGRLAG